MLKKLHNRQGYITSYIEYFLVSANGRLSKKGVYIYINDLWIHRSIRSSRPILQFIQEIGEQLKTAKYVYWKRAKHNERFSLYEILRGRKIKLVKKEIKHG